MNVRELRRQQNGEIVDMGGHILHYSGEKSLIRSLVREIDYKGVRGPRIWLTKKEEKQQREFYRLNF